jgi:hypothetical protein
MMKPGSNTKLLRQDDVQAAPIDDLKVTPLRTDAPRVLLLCVQELKLLFYKPALSTSSAETSRLGSLRRSEQGKALMR